MIQDYDFAVDELIKILRKRGFKEFKQESNDYTLEIKFKKKKKNE